MVQDQKDLVQVAENLVFIDDRSGLVNDNALPQLTDEFKQEVSSRIDELLCNQS